MKKRSKDKLLKNLFEVPDSYRNLVHGFEKADAFIAIVLFALYCFDMALSVSNGSLSHDILGFVHKCTIYAGFIYYAPDFILY